MTFNHKLNIRIRIMDLLNFIITWNISILKYKNVFNFSYNNKDAQIQNLF